MAYDPQTWTNGSGGGTPISAARLSHIEDGVEAAASTADANTTALAGKQPLDSDLTALAALTTPATKLSGIATGATANDTDANLKNRANHTGSQAAATISDSTTVGRSLLTTPSAAAALTTLGITTGELQNPEYRSATRLEPLPRWVCAGEAPMDTGTIWLLLFTPAANFTVSNILTSSNFGTSQTGATYCRVGLYSYASISSLTCIARSAHSATRWGSQALNTAPITENGAAGAISSVALTAGTTYAVAATSVGHTGSPKLTAASVSSNISSLTPPICLMATGQTTLPLSLTTASAAWIAPWFGLT